MPDQGQPQAQHTLPSAGGRHGRRDALRPHVSSRPQRVGLGTVTETSCTDRNPTQTSAATQRLPCTSCLFPAGVWCARGLQLTNTPAAPRAGHTLQVVRLRRKPLEATMTLFPHLLNTGPCCGYTKPRGAASLCHLPYPETLHCSTSEESPRCFTWVC